MRINERTRTFMDVAYAFGKESDLKSGNVAAYLDVSLKPIARLRRDLLTDDWQRNKYLWARVGYDRVFEITDSTADRVPDETDLDAIGIVLKWYY